MYTTCIIPGKNTSVWKTWTFKGIFQWLPGNIQLQMYAQKAWQAGKKYRAAIYIFIVKSFWSDYGLSHPTSFFNNFHLDFDFHSRAEFPKLFQKLIYRPCPFRGLLDLLWRKIPRSQRPEPGMFQALSENMEHFSDKQRLTLSRHAEILRNQWGMWTSIVCVVESPERFIKKPGVLRPPKEKRRFSRDSKWVHYRFSMDCKK